MAKVTEEVKSESVSLRQAQAANLGKGVCVIMIMSILCSFIPEEEKLVWPVAIPMCHVASLFS